MMYREEFAEFSGDTGHIVCTAYYEIGIFDDGRAWAELSHGRLDGWRIPRDRLEAVCGPAGVRRVETIIAEKVDSGEIVCDEEVAA